MRNVDATLWNKLANPQNLLEPVTRAQIPAELLPSLIAALAMPYGMPFSPDLVLMIIGFVVSFSMTSYAPATTPRGGG